MGSGGRGLGMLVFGGIDGALGGRLLPTSVLGGRGVQPLWGRERGLLSLIIEVVIKVLKVI